MIVRAAGPADFGAIAAVVAAAFGRPDEARMVKEARAGGDALAEFVAADDGEIVAHVLFNRMICEPSIAVAGLAPLAVATTRQRQGVGTRLARAGLAFCRAADMRGCVVLGAPAYYGRLGFTRAPPTIRSPYAGLAAFQVLEFETGVFASTVTVAYPPAFA